MCSKLKKNECIKTEGCEWIINKGCRKVEIIKKESLNIFIKPSIEELWVSDDVKLWNLVLEKYDIMLKISKKAELKELDDWYYNEFPQSIKEKGYITKEEHVKIMTWKLRRGQYRGILLKYANALTNEEVVSASKKALGQTQKDIGKIGEKENIKDIRKMLEEYSVLKGVGIATASILCSAKYDTIPFMSDELLSIIIGGKDWKYSWKEYEICLYALESKHQKIGLSKRDIEKAIFIVSVSDFPCKCL